MAAYLSFRDPITNVLKAHGFVSSNQPGDISQVEAGGFALTPGQWAWDGSQWIPFSSPPLPDPDQDLQDSIASATTVAQLKVVLASMLRRLRGTR